MQRKIFHSCQGAAFFYKNFALLLWRCVFIAEFRAFFDAAFLTRNPRYFAC